MALNFANNNSLSAITSLPASISGGAMTLLSTQTASSSSTISFTSGIDDTYDSYVFKFIDIHPATDSVRFSFQTSTNGGSSYGVTATTTNFQVVHNEADTSTDFSYKGNQDLAQSTSFQVFGNTQGNADDESACGELHLYNPSSTTFVKHFMAVQQQSAENDGSRQHFTAGYFNTTSAVDAVQFKFDSGNIDSGVIKLYGVS